MLGRSRISASEHVAVKAKESSERKNGHQSKKG